MPARQPRAAGNDVQQAVPGRGEQATNRIHLGARLRGHSANKGNDRADLLVQWGKEQGPYSRIPLRGETQERKELREAMRKRIAEEKKQKEECSDAPQAAATAALEDGHDDEVTTSGDGGTNAAVGDDTLETERSDSQPSQAGPYLTGSAQKY